MNTELFDKLESLFREGQTFWRNEHYAISKSVFITDGEYFDSHVKVTFSIFLGHHLPISTFVADIESGELQSIQLVTMKPITADEINLKILMI